MSLPETGRIPAGGGDRAIRSNSSARPWRTSGSTPTGISLGDVSFTLTAIGGTVTTNGSSPLAEGDLYVFGQLAGTLSDLYDQSPLGYAEIDGGSFSGYTAAAGSGYVCIYDYNTGTFYITPSPVTLNTSMSLNRAAMTLLTGD